MRKKSLQSRNLRRVQNVHDLEKFWISWFFDVFFQFCSRAGPRKGQERAVWLVFQQIEQKRVFLHISSTFVREGTAQGPGARGLAQFRAKCASIFFSFFSTVQQRPPAQIYMAGYFNKDKNSRSELWGNWVYLHRKLHVLLRWCVVLAKGNAAFCADLSLSEKFGRFPVLLSPLPPKYQYRQQGDRSGYSHHLII